MKRIQMISKRTITIVLACIMLLSIVSVGIFVNSGNKSKADQVTEQVTVSVSDEVDELKVEMVDPKEVRFMQSSIKNQTGEYTVLGNAEALKDGSLKAEDLPLIRLWKDESGQLWTLDHRRLAAFRLAGLDNVPFQWATEEEVSNQMWKMTTKTNGETIRLKLGNGESMIVE